MAFWRRGVSGRVRYLPRAGRAIVISDLHGHWSDWSAFLRASRALERIAAGEDLWLVITGDVPDVERHRALDPEVPEDGDVRILDALIAARAALGARGERIVYLEGNHDFHVARIWREVARFHAFARGHTPVGLDRVPDVTREDVVAYFAHYRDTYGEAIFANNLAPYDMIWRVRPEHVRFLEASPVLAVAPAAGVLVTHAGPPRMAGRSGRAVRREVARADREWMRTAPPEAYYASAYHQVLNHRFRSGDYGLDDVRAFLHAFGAGLLVTGHTPHPYLIDAARRAPIEHCAFRDGLGLVGAQQVVLCSSFGALEPGLKRYLEVDLARRHRGVDDLFADPGTEVRPLRPDDSAEGRRLDGQALVALVADEEPEPAVTRALDGDTTAIA